jgi:hypothetical protein
MTAAIARFTQPARSWRTRARLVHPERWLRRLRAGLLVVIIAAGLLCLLVTYQAHREITTVTGNGAQAIAEVDAVSAALTRADAAVGLTFRTGDVPLAGAGANYTDDITAATQGLVLAAEHNVAGIQGANAIQFAEGLLVTYTGLVQQATTDFTDSGDKTLALAELGYASNLLTQPGEIRNVLAGLAQTERLAVRTGLSSRWLGPGDLWSLLLAPFLVALLLGAGTSWVLWRGFRRLLSVRLTAAIMLTLGLVVLVASLNVHDGGHARAFINGQFASYTRGILAQGTPAAASAGAQAANPVPPEAADVSFAYSPWTLTAGLVLIVSAGVLSQAAYWPRLDEYRYRP